MSIPMRTTSLQKPSPLWLYWGCLHEYAGTTQHCRTPHSWNSYAETAPLTVSWMLWEEMRCLITEGHRETCCCPYTSLIPRFYVSLNSLDTDAAFTAKGSRCHALLYRGVLPAAWVLAGSVCGILLRECEDGGAEDPSSSYAMLFHSAFWRCTFRLFLP